MACFHGHWLWKGNQMAVVPSAWCMPCTASKTKYLLFTIFNVACWQTPVRVVLVGRYFIITAGEELRRSSVALWYQAEYRQCYIRFWHHPDRSLLFTQRPWIHHPAVSWSYKVSLPTLHPATPYHTIGHVWKKFLNKLYTECGVKKTQETFKKEIAFRVWRTIGGRATFGKPSDLNKCGMVARFGCFSPAWSDGWHFDWANFGYFVYWACPDEI